MQIIKRQGGSGNADYELMADYLVPKAGSFYPYYILLQTMHMARHCVLEHDSSTAARSISATRLPASTTDAMPFLRCREGAVKAGGCYRERQVLSSDLVMGTEEEQVGGEVWWLWGDLGDGHGWRHVRVVVVACGAPAERAGGVGVEPHADVVDVELVSASRQHARRLPGRELRDAYDALRASPSPTSRRGSFAID